MAKKDKPILFYAFPSNPAHIGETIEEFAKQISSGGIVETKTWQDMSITGLRIVG